jgi:F420H(2)-dependent quinone reductase
MPPGSWRRGRVPPERPAAASGRPGTRGRRGLVLTVSMPVDGEYEPSTASWVRDQVEVYESSGGTQGTTLRDTGLPVVIVTNTGASSGKVRKTPVMRVEHDGRYAMVASKGGAPAHPVWYYNVRANPRVEVQDGPHKQDMIAREVTGDERAEWWKRAVAAYPPSAEYQQKTTREIPVFVLGPATS